MSYSSNTVDTNIDFVAVARELVGSQSSKIAAKASQAVAKFSDGSELVPTEATARMNREGRNFLRRPDVTGATVDREGLTNTYAVEPQVYLAAFPSPEQARAYALQGAIAVLFVTGLIFTAFAVS